jgi:Outer membrane protein beta-barrel domain
MRIRYPKLFCLGFLLLGAQFGAQANAAGFFDDPRIRAGVAGGQLTVDDSTGYDGIATGWNFYTGFEFNRYLAVELGFLNGGTAIDDYYDDTLVPGSILYVSEEVESTSIHASVIGSWPINDDVSVYGRLGIQSWESTLRAEINGATVFGPQDDSGADPFYGLGVALNVDSGQLRLEYDMTKINDFNVGYVSLGVVWRFGF